MGLSLMYFEDGAARFASSVRGGDDAGHLVFELLLPSLPALYGEWDAKFETNGSDFNVQIVSFGYTDPRNISNPHPDARRRFSAEQQHSIGRRITALFSSAEAREGVFPFMTTKGHFLGGVRFLSGWVLLN